MPECCDSLLTSWACSGQNGVLTQLEIQSNTHGGYNFHRSQICVISQNGRMSVNENV